jgi:YVTN family beta-propeller protein
MKVVWYVLIGLVILMSHSGGVSAAPEEYLSPQALVVDDQGEHIYIGLKTAQQIVRIIPDSGKIDKRYTLPAQPNGLAISSDGKKLYVSTEEAEGRVCVVEVESGKLLMILRAGHTPMSPTLSPDGKMLYLCNRFDNTISFIDLASGKTTANIAVVREPIAQVLTSDGRTLYVANHLPTGAANVDFMTSIISVIDTQEKAVIKRIALPNGAIDLRELTVSPDGKYVYVPSIFARFLVTTTQIERGWINTHALNIIDAQRQKLVYTVLLDDVDLGAANPWGVACSSDNKHIVVAHSGTHELSVIDREKLFEKLATTPENDGTYEFEELMENPMNDLSFLVGLRRRIPLEGNGPRSLAVLGDRVFVTEYFSDSLGVVALDPEVADNVRSLALGPDRAMDPARKGEMLFNDASLCYQQWQSCSTCHPDARTDAVNWDLLNDGIGNPKSTKSLLYVHETPPVMISGVRANANVCVRAGIQFILFAVPEEDKASAIDAYLESIRPIPSPHLVDGQLSPKAVRGKELFENRAGCVWCHKGPYYTDMTLHDVGTGADNETGRVFDTPCLIEVWRSAPYLYDGRAATMKDVFRTFNPDNRHGHTSELSDAQLDNLIEYVLSL